MRGLERQGFMYVWKYVFGITTMVVNVPQMILFLATALNETVKGDKPWTSKWDDINFVNFIRPISSWTLHLSNYTKDIHFYFFEIDIVICQS